MIVVLAIDALEYALVEAYDTPHLKQLFYGKTDISEFSQPRTMVLWSSFMTGENKEAEVLARGDKAMWDIRWPIEETFFAKFENPLVIDLPGFSYDLDVHKRSRDTLKRFFDIEDPEEKERIRKQYNNAAFSHHRKIKTDFLRALEEGRDFVLGYFSLADVVGHLNFGNATLMRLIYRDLDDLAKSAARNAEKMLVVSDHGMKALGAFGDHSDYGLYSTSWDASLRNPKITEFSRLF